MRIRSFYPAVLALAVPAALAVLSACTAGGKMSASAANDELRLKIIEKDTRITALEGERDELKVKLAESQRVRESNLPQDALEALPRCTGVEIGTLSGFEPADPKVPAKSVVVYLSPRDGRARFVPIVGTLKVQALILPATLDQSVGAKPEEHVLAVVERTLGPAEVRDAYRSGLSGTHYAVEIPLAAPLADRAARVLFRVEFLDALTGQVQKAEWIKPAK